MVGEEAFMLDSDNLSQKVFDDLLAEGKTYGQGVLNYFRSTKHS